MENLYYLADKDDLFDQELIPEDYALLLNIDDNTIDDADFIIQKRYELHRSS